MVRGRHRLQIPMSSPGRFDGQGHTVSRMKAEAGTRAFGVVKDAEIRGVVVQGIAAGTDSSSGDAAGLVARTKGSTVTITECGSEVAVSGGANGGGILGKNHSGSTVVTISACYNTGDISGKERAGGISGGNTGEVNISDCYNTGSITGGSYAGGGIRGYYGGFVGTVANCYNSGRRYRYQYRRYRPGRQQQNQQLLLSGQRHGRQQRRGGADRPAAAGAGHQRRL